MKNPLTLILRSLEARLLNFGLRSVLEIDQPKDRKDMIVKESEEYSSMVVISTSNGFSNLIDLHYYGEVRTYDLANLMEIRILKRRVYIDGYNVRLRHRYFFKTQEDADALYASLSKRLEEYKKHSRL